MHVVDKPLGKGENPGLLIRSMGKQLYDPDDGSLAGAWLMDEATGKFVRDHGYCMNHGILSSGVAWVSDGIEIDGADQNVALGNSNFNFLDNFTIIAWISTTESATTYNTILGKHHTSYQNYIFYTNTSGKLGFFGPGGTSEGTGDDTNINDGGVHLVAVVLNGEESRFYKNGVVDGSKFSHATDLTQGNGNTFIGAYGSSGTSGNYDGFIYLIAIYDKVLTVEEIKAIYDVGLYRRTESFRVKNA